jgi:hypothetical protein
MPQGPMCSIDNVFSAQRLLPDFKLTRGCPVESPNATLYVETSYSIILVCNLFNFCA